MSNMSQAEMIALISKLQSDNAAKDKALENAKAQAAAKISLKVGEKGTVCLYHGARYPVPLYAEQWERILPFIKSGAIERFIEENEGLISRRKA